MHVVKNWAMERQVGGCGGYAGGLSAFARGPNANRRVKPEFFDCKKGRDRQRQSTSSQQGAHFWGPMPLGTVLIKKYPMEQNSTAQPRDMGQGMMTGFNTPWAQGPANSLSFS